MPLSLRESNAISDLAETLYDFLPGSGNKKWKGHITFQTVAEKIGVGDYWQQGSKTPAIIHLLEKTLQFNRNLFEPLILEIVRSGITYRKRRKRPIAPDEIDKINGLILDVGFKFPDLWDSQLKASLSLNGGQRAQQNIKQSISREVTKELKSTKRSQELNKLKDEFYTLCSESNRQKAGFSLEKILNRLFEVYGLKSREPFRVIGEQIDGSFELDHEIYLLEAKWEKDALSEQSLLAFRGKIEGKSKYTRGVFISINGISKPAKTAISIGKQPKGVEKYLLMFIKTLVRLIHESRFSAVR